MEKTKNDLDKLTEALKSRFHELGRKRDEILAVSTPLRERRDADVKALTGYELESLNAAIRDAETGLYDIDVERGLIAKRLTDPDGKSRMGNPEDYK